MRIRDLPSAKILQNFSLFLQSPAHLAMPDREAKTIFPLDAGPLLEEAFNCRTSSSPILMNPSSPAESSGKTAAEGPANPGDVLPSGSLTSDELLPVMYEKLRRLAASKLFRESGLQTLQPTALVHEAWLRLATSQSDWDSQAHFFGAAAEAMRRILVDRARTKSAVKRQLTDDPAFSQSDEPADGDHILLIHEALTRLEAEDAHAARIVMLKFFSGSTSEEIASMLGQSLRTVERQWTFAKARLYQMIQEDLNRP